MEPTQIELFDADASKRVKHRNRRQHNQYFTPEFAVERALSLVGQPDVRNIIDPAVGEGVFLKVSSKMWESAELFGVDIDSNVIASLQKQNWPNLRVICGDSLVPETWNDSPEIQRVLKQGGFDLVVGNPPFSSWFDLVRVPHILCHYELARRNGGFKKSMPVEVLFLERFIKLARDGGFIIIVLPDGVLSNPKYMYIRQFILAQTEVRHIISLPRNVFQDTSAKTSILVLRKTAGVSANYSTQSIAFHEPEVMADLIEVCSANLVERMDYRYHKNVQSCSLQGLQNGAITFNPLRAFTACCKTGKTLYGASRKFAPRGLRFLHATNITGIGIDYGRDEKFIDPMSKMYSPSAYARKGDVLFVRVGVGCAGRVAVVDDEQDEGVATDYTHILTVSGVDPHYLVVYLKTKYGRDSIDLLKHGVATISINKSDLLSLPIPVVPEELQILVRNEYKEILQLRRQGMNAERLHARMDALVSWLEGCLRRLAEEGLSEDLLQFKAALEVGGSYR